jgi:hypothetical protein
MTDIELWLFFAIRHKSETPDRTHPYSPAETN